MILCCTDKDRGRRDDFMGEAKVNLPKNDEQETATLPLTGKGAKGSVTVEFYGSDNGETQNCEM